jgi:hypothetical protein
VVDGTVTCGTRRNPARGIPGKNQTNAGIVLAKDMPDLKLLADNGAACCRDSRNKSGHRPYLASAARISKMHKPTAPSTGAVAAAAICEGVWVLS